MKMPGCPTQSRKKPSWTQYQWFSSEPVTVICDALSRWNWNQVYFIQDICEIKNIMLLLYLCDIVRKDVIWLLKPLVCYLKAKADNSNKSFSLSFVCYLNWSWLSWPFHIPGAHGERRSIWLTYYSFPSDSGLLISISFAGVLGDLFFLSFLMTSKPGIVLKDKQWYLIVNNCPVGIW